MTHTINGVVHYEIPLERFYEEPDELQGLPKMKPKEKVKTEYRRMTDEEKERIVFMYTVDEESIYRITQDTGYDHKCICRVLTDSGIKLAKRKTRTSKNKIERIKKLYAEGKRYDVIAKEVGCSVPTARKYRKGE